MDKYNKNLYYLQPNGDWKKGGDGRSKGLVKPPAKSKPKAKPKKK